MSERHVYYPAYYVKGTAAHVGQCFEGYDASLLASMLALAVTGKAPEPGCTPAKLLKLCDLKPFYNVQTAIDAYALFEYESTEGPERVLGAIKEIANGCRAEMDACLNERYREFCALTDVDYMPIKTNTALLDAGVLEGSEDGAGKSFSMEEIRALFEKSGILMPAVVSYYELRKKGGEDADD